MQIQACFSLLLVLLGSFFFDLYLVFWEGVVVLKDRGFEEGGGVLGAHLQMHLKREGVCHVPLQLAPPMKNGKGIA